jgi:ADP-dependent phosphofructokinase/glucokinase
MLETFFENLENFSPDLVLLSGLHMLEGQSEDFFSQRLKVVKNGLKNISVTLPVHLELASMANKDLGLVMNLVATGAVTGPQNSPTLYSIIRWISSCGM